MKDTGIWFHPSGILGASPGGIVDHETVLEVKCPYTERNLTIEEAAKSETFCLEKTESGQYALRKHIRSSSTINSNHQVMKHELSVME